MDRADQTIGWPVLLKHQPNASLARSRTSSFPYDWMHELYLEGLRKAGLPET